MAPKVSPDHQHILHMEARIQQQKELIADLHAQGKDASAAITRLSLLTRALTELQLQLGVLTPSNHDIKRQKREQKQAPPAGKK